MGTLEYGRFKKAKQIAMCLTWYRGLLGKPIEAPKTTIEGKKGIPQVLMDMKRKVLQKPGTQGKGC